MTEVLCLRPEADFTDLGVAVPGALSVSYLSPEDPTLGEAMARAEALVIPAVGPRLDSALFDGTPLRLVQVTGAGVDRVDGAALAAKGIAVANVPGGSDNAVTEYVLTAARWFLRGFAGASEAIFAGDYAAFRKSAIGEGMNELSGMTLGIVGLGRIGQAVAEAAIAAGAEVIYSDPVADGAVPLEQLFAEADVITLHIPLTDETRGLIRRAHFACMKPRGIFINAARGGIVDEAALAEALEAGRIAGAAVDVHADEPPSADAPLLKLSPDVRRRLILTPHVAGVTRQSWANLFRAAWQNVERVLIEDESPRHVTNGARI